MIKLENAMHIVAAVLVIFWIVVSLIADEPLKHTALLWAILLTLLGMKR